MPEIETIPLPTDEAKAKEPIHLQVNSLDAWPNHIFQIKFDWNSVMQRWIWEMTRGRDEEMLFPRSPVCLGRAYTFKGYLMAMFIDMGGTEDHVNAQNLGDEVQLAVFAGPDSPAWEPEPEPSEQRFE